MERLRVKLRFEESEYVEPKWLNGGLALWWKKEVNIKMLVGNKNKRKMVWEEIKLKVSNCKGFLMCIGDFNDVLYDMEKEGGKRKEKRKLKYFQKMVESCSLNDAHFQGQISL
ncbi:hypothetical protein CRYUN_Cryun19dG0020500 [Craigia yunnanensis]